jgi:aminoglycoside phosphotransferase family enzyme
MPLVLPEVCVYNNFMDIVAALMVPGAYPQPTSRVELVQTHISWIFLTDRFAYKVKKPVDLGFLNFTTLKRRHFYLHQELILNRRLCPEIYLEVLPIAAHKRGVRLGGPGLPVEYALEMRRMPQKSMMDEVADRGELTREHLDRIIERLVPFYAQAATGPRINKFGEPAIIHFNHQENFSRTAGLPGEILSPELFDRIKVFSWGFLQKNRQLFLRRIKEGRIRDCHGDLHMKNICLADGVYIYDCIEFNHRFRYGDVAADIDFLAMDLDFHGYRELSRYFVKGFARASGDRELLEILDFYKCYRAYVRGKINAFVAQDRAQSPETREQAGTVARAYFALAGEYAAAGERRAA